MSNYTPPDKLVKTVLISTGLSTLSVDRDFSNSAKFASYKSAEFALKVIVMSFCSVARTIDLDFE